MGTTKPVLEIKAGSIQATAWANESEYGPYHTVTIARVYRDQARRWQHTQEIRPHDIPAYAAVVKQMHRELSALASGQQTNPAALNASIHVQDGRRGAYYTTKLGRYYTDRNGTRQLAKGFRLQDLPILHDLVKDLERKFELMKTDPASLRLPKTTPISDIGLPGDEDEQDDLFRDRFETDHRAPFYEDTVAA